MAGSHYRINVGKDTGRKQYSDGKPAYAHLFATDPETGQFWDAETALEMLALMQEKFPAPEYSVTMMHWRLSGVDVTK